MRIDAELLIPGDGEPVPGATLTVADGKIVYAGPTVNAPDEVTAEPAEARVHTLMPGLWDAHAHLLGAKMLDHVAIALTPVAVRAARSVADLRAALDAGVTSIRDLGGLGVDLAEAVNEGSVVGPRIYGAGAILTPTGGHGDVPSLPLRLVGERDPGVRIESRICDGVSDCVRAVREQLRRSARLIKVCASGTMGTLIDNPSQLQFTPEELRAIVETAGLADRIVAAHAVGRPGILAAVQAGVRTIEHGSDLDDEACDAMRETGTILVPTCGVVEHFTSIPGLADEARSALERTAARHNESIARAIERGVEVALGTDAVTSHAFGASPVSWGSHGAELKRLVRLGMSPLAAIRSATAVGPATLGPQAPLTGQLVTGYDADMIALSINPLTEAHRLADPTVVEQVWIGGRLVKGTHAVAV
ncbi:hypothetical protein BAY59_26600 [Prauserella coralliicola]|uniref:Amidohydrolase family protein n=1 Tax=Prauserella endophytica TaxID=1592324 RepID=A0ABY2S5R4_9PSEU|nr:hypothetical protein BAY59_26600 [Prauserella coralliicola]TKG70658.1 amidohydrolase family protein [Prauserella endophytica]